MTDNALHTHVTREIRGPGDGCPACTEYHRSQFKCWREPSHDAVNIGIFGWPFCSICKAAPPYHERMKLMNVSFALGLYVPVDNRATAIIAPRSAVVGLPNGGEGDDEWIHVYYEGWINGRMQYEGLPELDVWKGGVLHASERMVTNYPTVAAAHLPADTLKCIGIYHPHPSLKMLEVHDDDALEEWLRG